MLVHDTIHQNMVNVTSIPGQTKFRRTNKNKVPAAGQLRKRTSSDCRRTAS